MAKQGGWPEKNPETKSYGAMTTPLSTTAASSDPRPGVNDIVPDSTPGNPVGYSGLGEGKKKK